ncbi:MAG: Spy/CpxP family protein refolding chaperone [Pseudomonadota bacterium]
MKKTMLLLLMIFGVFVTATADVISMKDNMRMRMFAGLDLTIAQKQDIGQIMRQLRQDNSIYAGERQSIHTQMKELMQQSEWDATLAEQLILENTDLRRELAANGAFAKHQIANILNEEQLAEIETRRQNMDIDDKRSVMFDKIKHRLDLSEQQILEVSVILTEQEALLADYQQSIEQHKAAEKALIRADVFDREAFIALNESFQETQREIALIRAKTRFDIAQLLTEEQREKMQKRLSKRARKPI